MEFNIISGNYKGRFPDVNSKEVYNWYVADSTDREGSKSQKQYLPTPGLKEFIDVAVTKPVRGMTIATTLGSKRCFAVIGDDLYELFKDKSYTNRGTLSGSVNSTAPVYFTMNENDQLGIFDGGSTADYLSTFTLVTNNGNLIGNVFTLSTNTLAAISDVDFPNTAADIGRIYFCNANDVTAWTGADVFTPQFRADPAQRIIAFRDELYCFGSETIQIYLNDGVTPFILREGASIDYGTVAPHSVAQYVNGIFFLGKSKAGQPAVFQITHDYQVQQLSPNTTTYNFGKFTHLEDCTGYVQYTKDGHLLYYLHIPSADTTLVYQQVNNEFHERRSLKPFTNNNGSRDNGMFRGSCLVNWDGLVLIGDRYLGKIFVEDYDTYTEDDLGIIREFTTLDFSFEYKTLSINVLELDLNTGFGATTGQGSKPRLLVQVSKDGGITWLDETEIDLGALGKYDSKARLYNLGMSNHWAFRFRLTDPIPCAIIGAVVQGSVGSYI